MINEHRPKLAWTLFTVSVLLSLIFDCTSRLFAADFYAGGLNEDVWFGLHITGFLGLILFMGKAHANFEYIKRLTKHLMPAVLFYLVSIYGYVLVLAIDSL